MSRIRGRRLTYANVVSTLALVIALGGGAAYAAGTIGSDDVIDNSLRSVDVHDGTLKGVDVGDGSLSGAQLKDGSVEAKDLARSAVALVAARPHGDTDVDTTGSSPVTYPLQ